MDDTTIAVWAVMLGAPLFIVLIATIILLSGRARPQVGMGAWADDDADGVAGRWNAQILDPGFVGSLGGSLGAVHGVFDVRAGQLAFFADDSPTPAWVVRCVELSARPNSAFATFGVLLTSPQGQLRCNVSRESINRVSRNTIKTLREAQYYREFVDVLVANGARRS